jgi:hypothetical protein
MAPVSSSLYLRWFMLPLFPVALRSHHSVPYSAICLLSIPSQGGHAKMALVCSSLLSPMVYATALERLRYVRNSAYAICLPGIPSQGGHAKMAPVSSSLYLRWFMLSLSRIRAPSHHFVLLSLRSFPPLYAYSACPRRADTRRWSFASSSLYLRWFMLSLSQIRALSLHFVPSLRYMPTRHPLAGRTREDGSC